ncbi:MAG TPA: hypothetical protein VK456_11895 [Xanthobacteraceae bacterium]|nr:hypothetical protein [Xanthobacteraceae bacterium]
MAGEDHNHLPSCPTCARPMTHAHTIRRAFAPNLHIFRCEPCDVTLREAEPGRRQP